MITRKKILRNFGGYVCRQCINKNFNIHLLHSDCLYGSPYPANCPCCGEVKNIVTNLAFSGYLKSLFK